LEAEFVKMSFSSNEDIPSSADHRRKLDPIIKKKFQKI